MKLRGCRRYGDDEVTWMLEMQQSWRYTDDEEKCSTASVTNPGKGKQQLHWQRLGM
jgi:hypothetical protein